MSEAHATISVVVPARNEASRIAATLERLREPEVLEVIVVDGGSLDATVAEARVRADRVVSSPAGRARQMNAGARLARGEVLFFLHADTLVPPGFGKTIVAALGVEGIVGGRFDVEIDEPGLGYRLISEGINIRSRWTGVFTGDQGLFVRKDVFDRLGGFPDLPLLEDLAFSTAMKRHGRIASLRERVRTSARRWREGGVVRTVFLMWAIRALYFAGVPPERLARLYRDVR